MAQLKISQGSRDHFSVAPVVMPTGTDGWNHSEAVVDYEIFKIFAS